MQGVVLHHRATLCLQRGTTEDTQIKNILKREVVSLARPLPGLAPHTHTWDKTFKPIRMLKSCCLDTMKNSSSCIIPGATNESRPPNLIVLYTRITATTPFYSTQAMVEHTSVSQNNPYKLYILSCHYIQLQCTRKRMHTTLLGRMPGPRRPIHVRLCIKKNQNAPILSEHPPVRRKVVKTFRWDQRL